MTQSHTNTTPALPCPFLTMRVMMGLVGLAEFAVEELYQVEHFFVFFCFTPHPSSSAFS